MSIDLQRLRYFCAVADESHFGRAAKRLYLAQPSLSDQIRRLEIEMGARLFNRSSRGVSLTAAGRVLYQHAERLLAEAESVEAAVHAVRDGYAGQIAVGFTMTHAYTVLPPVFRAFRSHYPEVEIVPKELRSTERITAVATNAVDVAFMYLAHEDESAKELGVSVEFLRAEGLAVALARNHPLATVRITPADLATERFVFLSSWRNLATYQAFSSLCCVAGFEPIVVREADDVHSLMALVASGIGIAIVSAPFASTERDEIAFSPLDESYAALSLFLARRSDDDSRLTHNFCELARALTGQANTVTTVNGASPAAHVS